MTGYSEVPKGFQVEGLEMRQTLLPSTRISSAGASCRVRHTEIAGSKERRVSKVNKDDEETWGHKEEKEGSRRGAMEVEERKVSR